MPVDGQGTYRHNDQVARLHTPQSGERGAAKGPGNEDGHTEVHNHGDGTFHTVHDGQEEHHESIGHMHAHLSKLHGAPGEKHFHAHHDGMSHHSHAVETGGEPEHKEHDPQNIEDAKNALGQFFNEEEKEGDWGGKDGYEKEEPEASHSSALGV